MKILGRSRELGQLRSYLDARDPHLVVVSGIRGGGKSTLVRHAMEDFPGIVHVCPPLPDSDQRAALRLRIQALCTGADVQPSSIPPDAGWEGLLDALLRCIPSGGRPFVLVLDDAHRLGEARSRYGAPVRRALERAGAEGRPFHVVLVAPGGAVAPGDVLEDRDARTGRTQNSKMNSGSVEVLPLPFRAAVARLPGRRPHEKLRAYGVFGGIPRILEQLDDSVTVGTNVRRLLLEPDAPLGDAGARWLELDLQSPARYYAIMRTLARGEADWAAVHAGVPDLTRSGQVAPYLKRLEELGLVEPRRSLDASPRGRSRRYGLTDPFLAFSFRFVLPHRWQDPSLADADPWRRWIRPALDDHLASVFPLVCRQHMEHDAIETLGHAARESGSLWGPGYDLPVAGILTSGAPYYGVCRWTMADGDEPFTDVDAAVRETRYGFGRERRLRLVFTGRSTPAAVRREAARRRDGEIIDAEALLG